MDLALVYAHVFSLRFFSLFTSEVKTPFNPCVPFETKWKDSTEPNIFIEEFRISYFYLLIIGDEKSYFSRVARINAGIGIIN